MKKLLLATTAFLLMLGSADAGPQSKRKSHKKTIKAKAKRTYYVNGPEGNTPTDETRPSAYKGDKVPENDGVKKNKERNMNYAIKQDSTGGEICFKSLEDIEKEHIKKVLTYTDNKTKAAEILGISRANLWRKLKEIENEKE